MERATHPTATATPEARQLPDCSCLSCLPGRFVGGMPDAATDGVVRGGLQRDLLQPTVSINAAACTGATRRRKAPQGAGDGTEAPM